MDSFNLDDQLMEGAKNLSVGQKQRLILARCLLRKSNVYIFDEIVSGVDQETIDDILEILYSLKKENIVILITHQLYLLNSFDKIYFLENGLLKESGNITSLSKTNNSFSYLYNKQIEIINDIDKKVKEKANEINV